ncbi:precorrin-2 dehydrogenase/sirohydrochlorin ferrochelatase family protein [Pseudalkalibacillus hwajinpoensis]|uniref:precorrin-2 dehydrogenase/sirohydrochlorin ferrochelatase family protein n=1 Tax=Guptibacillus hwajinpoensis TaxID=208199 RepID=UPI001CFE62F0|nr:NAD(P)-dependent oxidoreductase [Pseudalkalibacillus hwajinpoensis]
MSEYPVSLNLTGKSVLIVGGGRIALRKIRGLLGCGAILTVISPEMNEDIKKLVNTDNIYLVEREVRASDLQDVFLIIVATNSFEANEFVMNQAGDHQLVNASHQADRGNVSLPATLKRGRLIISVFTGGASPLLAKKIRDDLSVQYDESYSERVEYLYEKRLSIKSENRSESENRKVLENAVNHALNDSPEIN